MAGGAPIRISILANARQAKAEVNSFAGTLKRTLGAATVLAGGYSAVELLKDVANAGSEAQQTLGGTQAVFKRYAGEVRKYSERAADAVGLSENQYRSSATIIGSLLKGQGVQIDKLAGKTDNLIGIGADLAATYGGTAKEAVEALTSAFKGEFDPIERYGISLKQSTVNAEAGAIAQKQYGKSLKDLSVEQQTAAKQQATYRLVMQKSADAQGQFAREADTLAGKQQRLSAEIENTKTKLGTALLPVLTEAADAAQRDLLPALDEFADWFADNIDDIAASGKTIAKSFLPPLQLTADVAMAAAKALDQVPPPVKELAVELLIAAKAFNVLEAAGVAAGGGVQNLLQPLSTYRAEISRATADFRAGAIGQQAYTDAVTRSAQTLGSRLQPAVASAAGMAGMGLLLTSTQQNDKALNTLMKSAGGAATGFAVGGPLGGAIGGLAGLLWGARDAYNATERATRQAAAEAKKTESWNTAKEAALELRDALYGTRDAYNEVTAASVKKGLFADGKKVGWVQDLEAAGVNIDTITRAILGQRDAQALVNAAFKEQDASLSQQKARIQEIRDELARMGEPDLMGGDVESVARFDELTAELSKLKQAYDEEKTAVDSRNESYGKLAGTTAQQAALEQRIRAELSLTKKQYDAIPKTVRTKIESEGLPQTKQSVLDLLATTDKLSGRQVVAIVKQSGAKLAKTEIEALQKRYELTPEEVATLVKVNGANRAKSDAAKAGKDAGDAFGRNTAAGVRDRSGDVREAARAAVERARAAARAEADGASSIGVQITAGIAQGIGTGEAVASAARQVIRNALAAARREAEIKSPSRKAARDGRNISRGYAVGIRQAWPEVRAAVTSGMASLFEKQPSPVSTYINDVRAQARAALRTAEDATEQRIRDRYAKKISKADSKAEKRDLQSARARELARLAKQRVRAEQRARKVIDQYSKKVRNNYRAWVKTSAELESARAKLEELKQEAATFRSSVQASVKGWFDPITAGLEKSAAWTESGGLLASILGTAAEQKAQVSQTRQLLNQALARGLTKDAYEKILSLSREDANKTAVALASATSSQIRELNSYYASVEKDAASAGYQAYNSFFKVGIQAQQGIVDGLVKDKKSLERAADKMGAALVKAVKRRLGIKSPSRVFREMGEQVTAGLEVGVDVPRVSALGREMARSLERGFDPRELVASAHAGGGASQTVINVNYTPPLGMPDADVGQYLAKFLRAYIKVSGSL